MFRFSGDGITFIEKLKRENDSSWNWIKFLKEFFSLGAYGFNCRCTRIDLAFDDISYDSNCLIDLDIVADALINGEYTSMFRKNSTDNSLLDARQRVERNKNGETGNTIYLGNRKSKVFMRIYDKLAETKAHKEPYDEKIKHWVRLEFEFKDVRAMTVCDSLMLLSPEQFGEYMSKVTNNYVRFIVPKGDRSHYYRCSSQKWWLKVVKTIEKARLTENKTYKNRFNASMKWLRRQVFPTIYAILHCLKVDEFISDVKQCGVERIVKYGDNREMIIKDYLSDKLSVSLNGLDIHTLTSDKFKELIRDLETCAFGTRMRQQGHDLCEVLGMMKEYKEFHRVRIEGMFGKNEGCSIRHLAENYTQLRKINIKAIKLKAKKLMRKTFVITQYQPKPKIKNSIKSKKSKNSRLRPNRVEERFRKNKLYEKQLLRVQTAEPPERIFLLGGFPRKKHVELIPLDYGKIVLFTVQRTAAHIVFLECREKTCFPRHSGKNKDKRKK